MKSGLKEINETPGVWGSLVCNGRGDIIEELTPPALNKAALENISRHILDMIGIGGEDRIDLNEVVLHYHQRKLFALSFQEALLIVICTPSVDIPLLRMSVNIIISGWQDDRKIQDRIIKANK